MPYSSKHKLCVRIDTNRWGLHRNNIRFLVVKAFRTFLEKLNTKLAWIVRLADLCRDSCGRGGALFWGVGGWMVTFSHIPSPHQKKKKNTYILGMWEPNDEGMRPNLWMFFFFFVVKLMIVRIEFYSIYSALSYQHVE